MKGPELRALRLKTLNKATGEHLTQAEAARLLGIHKNSMARAERDEMTITPAMARLARLVLVGDVDVGDPDD